MLIGGIQKLSLTDYPGKLAAIIFVQGCPLRCQFCHNPSLVLPPLYSTLIPFEEILHFLTQRKNDLEGVVISGGEPTSQNDLFEAVSQIKALGYAVKLDTAGTNPASVEKLLKARLIDYIAMDIKAPLEKYEAVVKTKVDPAIILQSIRLILQAPVAKEFRTTLVQGLHEKEDVLEMVRLIKGETLYVLQKFVNQAPLNPFFKSKTTFDDETLFSLQKEAEKYVTACLIK
ncbi:MAG: anaerobic ribonucleoside-triphosphate reductase activating protein [Parachlamydiales bacterium]|jgi:pyruvate formate lyase activating enzyme